MKTMLTTAVLFGLGLSRFAIADPLDIKHIPQDAKWVLHVDMDAARDTKTWMAIDNQLSTNQDFQQGIHQIEQLTNAQFPRDLHDVTLYGRSSDEDAGIVIIHAHVDRKQIMGLLQQNQSFASKTVGDYELLTWDDKGKAMHGSFHDDSTMIIGHSEELVRDALEVMDGKATSIKEESPLAVGAKPQILAFVAAADLADLTKKGEAKNPILSPVKSAWISLTEADGTALVKANITANTADAATQLGQMIDGARAMIALSAGQQNNNADADPKPAALTSLLKSLTFKKDDKSILVEWPIAIDKGEEALAVLAPKKPHGNEP